MGNFQNTNPNANNDSNNNGPRSRISAMTSIQTAKLQRLFSRGLLPDIGLLPYQMKRMKNDAPPQAQQNRRTIRMKNLCYVEKKSFGLTSLENNRYLIHFQYSSTIDICCSIYLFANEIMDEYQCPLQFIEKCPRSIISAESAANDSNHNNNNNNRGNRGNGHGNGNGNGNDGSSTHCVSGTSYLLRKGNGLAFEQSAHDVIDLSEIAPKFFGVIPSLDYYPIILVFSRKQPKHTLLCDTDARLHSQSPMNNTENTSTNVTSTNSLLSQSTTDVLANTTNRMHSSSTNDHPQQKVAYVTSVIMYGKLVLQDNRLYTAQIVAEKTQVHNRAFESQQIYGLTNDTAMHANRNAGAEHSDDEQNEDGTNNENLCVICLTMPKDTALCPCRHLCMCNGCAKELLKRSNKCPICRAFVVETIKISLEQ